MLNKWLFLFFSLALDLRRRLTFRIDVQLHSRIQKFFWIVVVHALRQVEQSIARLLVIVL